MNKIVRLKALIKLKGQFMRDSGVGEVNPSYDTDTEPLVLGE
jgi:hypothetical protein